MIYTVSTQTDLHLANATLSARQIKRILIGQTVDLSQFIPRQQVEAEYLPLSSVTRDYVPAAVVRTDFIHRDSIRARMRAFNIRISR